MLTPLVTLLNSKHKSVNALILIITAFTLQACGLPDGSREGIGAGINSVDNSDENAPTESITIEIERLNGDLANGNVSIVTLNQNFEDRGSNTDVPKHEPAEKISKGIYKFQFDSVYVEQANIVVKVVLDNNQILYSPLYSLQNNNQTIKVNIASHYVLKKLFDTIETSADLEELTKCSDGQDNDCANQSVTKADLLEQITLAAQAYDIEFSKTYSVIGAVEALDDALVLNKDQESIAQLEFRNHIETAVAEITRITSPIAKGTSRSFNILDGADLSNSTSAQKYNSVLFGLSFASSTPDEEEKILIGAYTSHILDTSIGDNDTEVTIYPTLHHTYFILDKRRDTTISEIPFLRTALTISEEAIPALTRGRNSSEFKEKTIISNLTDTFLSTEGFLLLPRIIEQVTDKDPDNENDPSFTGWQFDPMFSKLYQANDYEIDIPGLENDLSEEEFEEEADTEDTEADETPEEIDFGPAPTWLLTANYSKGAKFQLSSSSDDDTTTRVRQEEASQIFSWEIHGLETSPEFSLSQLTGNDYGVINYSTKFNDDEAVMQTDDSYTVLKTYAEMLEWDVSSTTDFNVSQPTNYETKTISRSANNEFNRVITESGTFRPRRNIFFLKDDDSNDIKTGQIVLDGGTTRPEGHASQNGNYMAFAFDLPENESPSDRGAGIIIATKKFTMNANAFGTVGTKYQLQGNSLGIDAEHNTLMNFNGSSLSISGTNVSTCTASIELKRSYLQHRIIGPDINTLLDPKSDPDPDSDSEPFITAESESCTITENMVRISFANIFEQSLVLQGFITEADDAITPGNLISLLWVQEDNLGLVFALKEQDLCHKIIPKNETCK